MDAWLEGTSVQYVPLLCVQCDGSRPALTRCSACGPSGAVCTECSASSHQGSLHMREIFSMDTCSWNLLWPSERVTLEHRIACDCPELDPQYAIDIVTMQGAVPTLTVSSTMHPEMHVWVVCAGYAVPAQIHACSTCDPIRVLAALGYFPHTPTRPVRAYERRWMECLSKVCHSI